MSIVMEKPFVKLGCEAFNSIYEALLYLSENEYEDAVLTLSGIHYFDKSIVIDDNFPGSSIKKLTFISDKENPATLTGACQISPRWEPYDDDIFMANIGAGLKIDALFLNGVRQILARYPNYQPGMILGGYCADALSPERVARWKNPVGGYIRALHHHEWGGNSFIIDGKDNDGNLLYRWVGDNNRGSEMHNVKRMVENIFEELDSPGEWFYDSKTGILYFYPLDDENIDEAIFEIVTTEELFRIVGTIDKPVAFFTPAAFQSNNYHIKSPLL